MRGKKRSASPVKPRVPRGWRQVYTGVPRTTDRAWNWESRRWERPTIADLPRVEDYELLIRKIRRAPRKGRKKR